MLTKVHHIAIAVRDVEKMVQFLKTLGLEEVRRLDHHGGAVEMSLPGENQVILDFHKVGEGEELGVNHIAFLVDDPMATEADLKAKGVSFTEGGFKGRPSGRMSANIPDTLGVSIQLTQ